MYVPNPKTCFVCAFYSCDTVFVLSMIYDRWLWDLIFKEGMCVLFKNDYNSIFIGDYVEVLSTCDSDGCTCLFVWENRWQMPSWGTRCSHTTTVPTLPSCVRKLVCYRGHWSTTVTCTTSSVLWSTHTCSTLRSGPVAWHMFAIIMRLYVPIDLFVCNTLPPVAGELLWLSVSGRLPGVPQSYAVGQHPAESAALCSSCI